MINLCKPFAIRVRNQRVVIIDRRRIVQHGLHKHMQRRQIVKVHAPHHMRNPLQRIIDDAGKVIGRIARILAPQDRIANGVDQGVVGDLDQIWRAGPDFKIRERAINPC